MSEQNTPQGEQPQAEQQAPQTEQQAQDNFRQMREATERAQAEAREAREQVRVFEARMKERQRAEMSEVERTRAELEELRQVAAQAEQARDELGRWQNWAQQDYEKELARVPDLEARENLRRMTGNGDWRERLESLKGARAMFGQLERAQREAEKAKEQLERLQQQSPYGTRTNPQTPRPAAPLPPPQNTGFDHTKIPSWDQVLTPMRRPGRRTDTDTDT